MFPSIILDDIPIQNFILKKAWLQSEPIRLIDRIELSQEIHLINHFIGVKSILIWDTLVKIQNMKV